jgi:DNA-binding response OmpR family regulator
MPKILVVDDEPDIIDLAALYLESDGFEVLRAEDGAQALEQVKVGAPDLVLLDIMLPEIDGWEVCRRIRSDSELPIIMLSARGDPVDRVIGLELGADDYMIKPFHGRELTARVKAVLRRSPRRTVQGVGPVDENRLAIGDLEIDAARRTVRVGDASLDMRAREFELLTYMARHEGLVLSRDQLLDQVWGYDFLGDSRTVDVHIAHVRNHLSVSQGVAIETIWGVGYKLVTKPITSS